MGGANGFWQVAQVKDIGGPSWGWSIKIDGEEATDGQNHYDVALWDYNASDSAWVGPDIDGNWHDITVEVNYETNTTGWIKVWFDGVPQTFNEGPQSGSTQLTNVQTLADPASSQPLLINSYRAYNLDTDQPTIYHGPALVGTTLASVEPAGGWGNP
jgi:hypothetical protein